MFNDLVESFSGIRGLYGQSITEDLAYRYAFCYCQLFDKKDKTLMLAGDSRPSTPALKKAMLEALTDCGVKKVIDIGIAPVQVCEYAVLQLKAAGGVYISASHNEPAYNGWKFLKEDGALLYAAQSEKLIQEVHKTSKRARQKLTRNIVIVNRHKTAVNKYINYVERRLGKKSAAAIRKAGIKILLDPNGGAAITILEGLCQKLGVAAKIINNEIGAFKRLVEPNVKSLAYLKDIVAEERFSFAAGFDADADRVEFVVNPNSAFAREMGAAVSGQYVLTLACDALLQNTKGQVVVTNDATSYLIREVIKKHKAEMKEVEVGEMPVVEGMEKNKSIIGGEGSNGGVIIPPIKCRDGIMTIALILKLMALNKKPLEEILDGYPRYYESTVKVNCSPEKSLVIKKEAETFFRSLGYKIKKTGDENGGLKALPDPDNFVWFRQSRTEPGVFRIFSEGNNKEKVEGLLKEGIRLFFNENYKNKTNGAWANHQGSHQSN